MSTKKYCISIYLVLIVSHEKWMIGKNHAKRYRRKQLNNLTRT